MNPLASFFIRREVLERIFGKRWGLAFENQQQTLATVSEASSQAVSATQALKDAAFVTLSSNAELPNERVLQLGDGLEAVISADTVLIRLSEDGARATGGFKVTFIATGESTVAVPLTGILATRENVETLTNKTLSAPSMTALVNASSDASAASAGVPVGGVYRDGSTLKVRVS